MAILDPRYSTWLRRHRAGEALAATLRRAGRVALDTGSKPKPSGGQISGPGDDGNNIARDGDGQKAVSQR